MPPGDLPRSESKQLVLRALTRGRDRGESGLAIFLPAEDVRCIGRFIARDGEHVPCAQFLFHNDSEFEVQVRLADRRTWRMGKGDRRHVPRGTHRCPDRASGKWGRCGLHLSIEFHECQHGRDAA